MPLNAQTGFNMIIIEQFKVHNIITNYVTSFGKGIFWSILQIEASMNWTDSKHILQKYDPFYSHTRV